MTRTSTMMGVSPRAGLPLLEGPAEALPEAGGQFADFIEEQRAAVGLAEPPFAALVRPVNAPFSCLSNSGLNGGFVRSRTVDGDERRALSGHWPP